MLINFPRYPGQARRDALRFLRRRDAPGSPRWLWRELFLNYLVSLARFLRR